MQRYFDALCQISDEIFVLYVIIDYLKCLIDVPMTAKDIARFCSIIEENEILNG